ncbi:hypothetical protein GCM10009425_40200 [Pseudomonas asuensis]|uniref:Uncharacterized protein n=1 Tax=Pseudomonas asuensis TaxID=1825787 RepID=A0ABQ2H2B9_9PSED|nr:hypothetical protein [Pseudomonas asuensis]GGM25397.1 hypothetical protein GCM10009425_40200 [Pseudomonas asuensis]
MSLKHITYGVGGGLVGVVALVGMQLVTTVKAADQAREAAIIAWAESNPSEAETVKRYRQECLCSPTDALLRPATVRPFTFAECAEKIGSGELASAIDAAAQSVEIPAPLRWL